MADKQFDIIGRTKLWFTLSGAAAGIGILFMIINTLSPQLNYGHHYPLKLGIDFTGGTIYQLVYDVKVGTDITDTLALVGDIHQRVEQHDQDGAAGAGGQGYGRGPGDTGSLR